MVIVVAIHKSHDAGSIGQYKTKGLLKKFTRFFDGVAVEHSMRQANRPILRNRHIVRPLRITVNNFDSAAIWIANDHHLAAHRVERSTCSFNHPSRSDGGLCNVL